MPADNEPRWWLEPLPEGAGEEHAHDFDHDDEPPLVDQDNGGDTDGA
jgi:hypothetical protein